MFAVNDALHDYASAVQAAFDETLRGVFVSTLDFGPFNGGVLQRYGSLQVELITVLPGATITPHRHPGVDSIDLLVAGNVSEFQIDQTKLPRFIPHVGLRIAEWAVHGGRANDEGVTFLSCQSWNREPSHIGLAWRGKPVGRLHADLLERLNKIS